MFEVSFINKQGEKETHIVKLHFVARQLAKQAIENNSQSVLIRLQRLDIWLFDKKTGEFHRIYRRLTPKAAVKIVKNWTWLDRDSGLLLWPSEAKMPRSFKRERAA